MTVTTASAGTFNIAGSDCEASSNYAFFHFGSAGSGEEGRVDISTGYRGPGTYGPGTFGVSSTISHANELWIVNFSSSPDADLTVGSDGRSGTVTFTSQAGAQERVSASFVC
jgi:hypothetical protein